MARRAEILAIVANLAGGDSTKQNESLYKLDALQVSYWGDFPKPRGRVAPHLPGLVRWLSAECPEVLKGWCAQLLADLDMQNGECLEGLSCALKCKNDDVLMSVILAIGYYPWNAIAIYGKTANRAVEALFKLISHPNPDVRWRVVWALKSLGPKGREFAERFATLFDDPNRLVRLYAVYAFVKSTEPSEWSIEVLSGAPRTIVVRRTIKEWREAIKRSGSGNETGKSGVGANIR